MISMSNLPQRPARHAPWAILLCAVTAATQAGVLPEDRADVLYHVYDGGGVTVQGPSLLVRKKFGESLSANVTYDVDMVSSASIDVLSAASEYKEHRSQWSTGASYLRGKTTYSLNYLNSTEDDYISDNASLSISEDMFGDLTTVSLGFTRGWDDVKQRLDKSGNSYADKGNVDRRNYRLGISQILTKTLLMNLTYESSAQEGYLQNPYRRVRYGAPNSTAIGYQNEIYPNTRTANAVALDGRYYLPYRASLKAGYRFYTDDWGITAHTGELEYVHPVRSNWIVETSVRYYTQTRADFYADLFPYIDAQNFLARDKELSTFNDVSFRIGLNWRKRFTQRVSGVTSVFYDRIEYSYQDFRNNLPQYSNTAPGSQPLYSYGANVFQLQYSLQF